MKNICGLLDRVIAIIKQHERPVDEEQLGQLAVRIIDIVQEHIASGATPLRTAICRALRPYLKQQQPVRAAVLERVAIALYNVHREEDSRLLWEELPNDYLRKAWRELAQAVVNIKESKLRPEAALERVNKLIQLWRERADYIVNCIDIGSSNTPEDRARGAEIQVCIKEILAAMQANIAAKEWGYGRRFSGKIIHHKR